MPRNNKNATAPTILIEDLKVYQREEKELLEHFEPIDEAETGLLRDIARHRWLVRRALLWQQDYLVRTKWVMGRDFNLLLRYQTQNDVTSQRLFRLLLSLRRKKALARSGFFSQTMQELATDSQIYPHISDRWAHNTAVVDPETGDFVLLKVLRDRENQNNKRRPT